MTGANVMVCVTQQRTCERLIMNGYNLVRAQEGKLYIVHVVNEKGKFLNHGDDGEALEYLFDVSKKVGANLTVLRSKDVTKTIIDFARENDITHIIMGTAPGAESKENISFAFKLKSALPDVELIEM
ncbi:MAG TPA: universal stress protein [Tepidimicrobium sp.]|nr:universal stress protein [Tepidimicrobium sp.]